MVRRRHVTVIGLVAVVLALTACWPVPGQNPDRTAHNDLERTLTRQVVGDLEELWATSQATGAVRHLIVVEGGVIAGEDDALHRVDGATGEHEWTWGPAAGYPAVVGAPAFGVDDRILAAYGQIGRASSYYSSWLDPVSGEVIEDAPSIGLPAGVRGDRAVGTSVQWADGTTFGVNIEITDLSTGTRSVALVDLGEQSTGIPFGVTLGGARVYQSGFGVADSATFTREIAVRAFPVTGGTTTCGPPEWPQFACATWTSPVGPAPTAPVIGPGEAEIYVGTGAGTVVALDAATGAIRWTVDVGAAVPTPPALAEGVLYAGTAAGTLVAVDAHGCGAATCRPLWTATGGPAPIATQPAVGGTGTDAVVYVGTTDGTVRAHAAAGCGKRTCRHPLWTAPAGGPVTGGPIVSGGRVYVGTENGRLVAYGLPRP
jgi:outer membrane protein assembly factor BamB